MNTPLDVEDVLKRIAGIAKRRVKLKAEQKRLVMLLEAAFPPKTLAKHRAAGPEQPKRKNRGRI